MVDWCIFTTSTFSCPILRYEFYLSTVHPYLVKNMHLVILIDHKAIRSLDFFIRVNSSLKDFAALAYVKIPSFHL